MCQPLVAIDKNGIFVWKDIIFFCMKLSFEPLNVKLL